MSEKSSPGNSLRLDEVLRDVYLKIHSREINESEMGHIKRAMSVDPSGTIIAMVRSTELLSNLLLSDPLPEVAGNALNYALRLRKTDALPEKRFFMHIPKSGGTSIIHHLQEHSNFPWHHSVGETSLNLWPLVAGHFHWSIFPSNSKGFTILRDPLQRLISNWRFETSYSQHLFRKVDDKVYLNLNFTDFVNNEITGEESYSRLQMSWFFTDKPLHSPIYGETSHNKLERLFNDFYSSIENIGCIEESDSVNQALKFATGKDTHLFTTKNQTTRVNSDPQTLSKGEYDRLFDITDFDYRFFNHLFEKGIITHDYSQDKETKLMQYLDRLGLTVD